MKRNLVSLAGYDPSAGAGVLLDIRVFARFGFHGTAIVTAVTTQNTKSVKNVYVLPGRLVREQFRVLDADIVMSGLKVGMAGSWENLRAIARILAEKTGVPKVVDSVFRSSSGAPLLDTADGPDFLREIKGRASVITPNMEEAGLLAGGTVRTVADMVEAAKSIFDLGRIPCLVKGGHLAGEAVNILYDGRTTSLLGKPRLRRDVHGTGCYFSACLLCYLAQKKSLAGAAELATEDTHHAIRTAVPVGRGRRVFA